MDTSLRPTDVQTILLPRTVWERLLSTAVAPLSPVQRLLTQWIIFELHNRHVGVPVDMAVKTAQLIASHSQSIPWPWDMISAMLHSTLKNLYSADGSAASQEPLYVDEFSRQLTTQGILLHTVPRYVVLDLLLPVVDQVCRTVIHQNMLFCADDIEEQRLDAFPLTILPGWALNGLHRLDRKAAGLFARRRVNLYEDQYQTYANCFKQDALDLDKVLQGLDPIFWKDRLYTLFSLSHTIPAFDETQPPAMRLNTTRIFLEHRPDMTQRGDWSQHNVKLAHSPIITSTTLEDAGVDGVTITRDIGKVNRMLLSEWVTMMGGENGENGENGPAADSRQPSMELMWLNRMINEGYGVVKRPPLRIQLRDSFIMGLCPDIVRSQPTGLFLKTVWFEFALRMSRLLRGNNLTLSELRWVEGDPTQGMRSNLLLVQYMPDMGGNIDDTDSHAQHIRHRFIKATGWFPSYLAQRETFTPLPRVTDKDHLMLNEDTDSAESIESAESAVDQALLKPILAWMVEAQRAQREIDQWAMFRDAQGSYKSRLFQLAPMRLRLGFDQLNLSHFAYTHLMIFLPMSLYKKTRTYKTWSRRFTGFSNISITWVPDHFGTPQEAGQSSQADRHSAADWRFSGFKAQDKLVWSPADAETDSQVKLGYLSAQLLETWASTMIKEMRRE